MCGGGVGAPFRSKTEREIETVDVRISLVIPAYNAAETLPMTLLSVCQQLRPPDELVFVDDGSTDATVEVVERYRPLLPCPLRIIRTERQGPNHARNIAIKLAKGNFIAFLDADDLWLPEKLLLQEPLLKAGYRFVATDFAVMSEIGELAFVKCRLRCGRVARRMLGAPLCAGQTVVAERRLLLDVGGFPNLPVGEDHALWMRLAKRARLVVVPRILALVRQRKGSLSWNPERALKGMIMQMEEAIRLMPGEFGPLFRAAWRLAPRLRPLICAIKRLHLCGPAESRRRIISWLKLLRRRSP